MTQNIARYRRAPLLLVLALGWPDLTSAIQWPVVTSMTVDILSPTEAKYSNINWTWVNLPWPGNEQGVYFGQTLVVGHRHNAGGAPPYEKLMWVQEDWKLCLQPEPGSDRCLPRNMNLELPSAVYHWGSPNGQECVGVRETRQLPALFDSTHGPALSCVNTPPANQWCNITTPQITLDHGTVALGDAAGHSSQVPVSISCSAPMSISLILGDYTDTVKMNSGVTAKLSVDNKRLGTVLHMTAGTRQVTVSDQLSAGPGGVAAGFYQGTAVMILRYE